MTGSFSLKILVDAFVGEVPDQKLTQLCNFMKSLITSFLGASRSYFKILSLFSHFLSHLMLIWFEIYFIGCVALP